MNPQHQTEASKQLVVHCKRDAFDVHAGRKSRGAPGVKQQGRHKKDGKDKAPPPIPGSSGEWGNPFVTENQSESER